MLQMWKVHSGFCCLFYNAISVLGNTMKIVWLWMINWKGYGRKKLRPIKVLILHFSGMTEKNYKKSQNNYGTIWNMHQTLLEYKPMYTLHRIRIRHSYTKTIVNDSGTQTEANKCNWSLSLFSGQENLSQLFSNLSRSTTADTPRVVYHWCKCDQRRWPCYCIYKSYKNHLEY